VDEGVDAGVEHELHAVPDGRVQGLGQLAARYLQVASGVAAGDGVRGQGGQLAAVAAQEGEAAQADVRVAQPWQEGHALPDVERGAADVDRGAGAAAGGWLRA